MTKESVVQQISEYILVYDADKLIEAVKEALTQNIPPYEIVLAMSKGMQVVGQKFEDKEYFIPDLLMAADAMKSAMDILDPYIATERAAATGKVLIGTVAGDIHDIGKNIVITFLKSAGFEVHDLGTDVPVEEFVEKVKELNPDILGMSTLMTTGMPVMSEIMEALRRGSLRDRVKVILGGAPITNEFGERVGADAVSVEAIHGVRIMERWMKEKSSA